MVLTFHEIKVEGYERVLEVVDDKSGLHAIIAIHDTRLGPALGGIRVWPYLTFEAALTDVLRLSKGMTYKSAISQTGTGGGKSVILTKKGKLLTEEMLLAFAEAVDLLKGVYIGAEDVGMSPQDLIKMRPKTHYVVGLPHPKSSGDPSRFTAWGGYRGIQAICKKLYGNESVAGRTIAIQGLGAVGMKLANYLFWGGAKLIVSDIDAQKMNVAANDFNAKVVTSENIHKVDCDILAPCALGASINPQTIGFLKCSAIGGLANNQLLTDDDGETLKERGILYAPDYVINSGGLLNVCSELQESGYDPVLARDKVNKIYDHLLAIFERAEKRGISTSKSAGELAENNLSNRVGKSDKPFVFHH